MSVRTRVLDDARHRAHTARLEIGSELRAARLQSGLPLRRVGAAMGRSASWLSRLERGRVACVTMDDLIIAASAVGLRVWVRTFPGPRAIRDAPQLELLRRLRARVGSSWTWRYEVPVPIPRDQRAADAVMTNGAAVVMVEAFTRMSDAQAQVRSCSLKARDMGIARLIIVLAATRRNREAVAGASELITAEFPLDTRSVLRALASGRDPGANGVVLI